MIKAAHLGVSHGQIHLGMAHYMSLLKMRIYIRPLFISYR